MSRLNLAILISGRGSNMEALLRAAAAPDYPARPVLVLSNRPNALGLETALAAGVQAVAIDHKAYGKDREAFERAMDAALIGAGTEIIALAGFMRVLTPWFVGKWQGRMVNIHPSLLPKYKGLDTHQRAIDAGDTEAGATVHWVSPGVDDGEIIQQASLPILPGDTAETLAARLLPVEHALYPAALAKACAVVASVG
ncbi:MAG: phosphoribosylglycinamide formyltransferase [Hyphomonas sp. BRH_c22]|uniref:phosphoribosylglycinamide formyltransferase n=1 Tax=Hyphomonas sp. BRH_c22 TaxID=1629710 RepID=UPI0005F0F2FB|nr:phosphoribosylglycinamide formyltransferase [Hyphomonas sp. BRH_c22]KJS36333.1 MAG: phosphoribosylglycinamide formyltransferase [Hyphomonas sp. BRH_c22]